MPHFSRRSFTFLLSCAAVFAPALYSQSKNSVNSFDSHNCRKTQHRKAVIDREVRADMAFLADD